MNRIKEIRERCGMTQKELAQKLNINRATLSKYENEQIDTSITQLDRIAKTLGVSPMELLGIAPKCDTPENRAIVEAGVNAAVETMAAFEQDKKLQLEILFDRLNQTGKAEAVKRVGELTQIPKYTEPDKKTPSEEQDTPPDGNK